MPPGLGEAWASTRGEATGTLSQMTANALGSAGIGPMSLGMGVPSLPSTPGEGIFDRLTPGAPDVSALAASGYKVGQVDPASGQINDADVDQATIATARVRVSLEEQVDEAFAEQLQESQPLGIEDAVVPGQETLKETVSNLAQDLAKGWGPAPGDSWEEHLERQVGAEETPQPQMAGGMKEIVGMYTDLFERISHAKVEPV